MPSLTRWMGIALLQGALGYIQYFSDVPELLVGIHVLGATLVMIVTTFLVLDTRRPLTGGLEPEVGSFRIRRRDWDEPADFAKVIRFFTIGRKEYNVYFTVNSLLPQTLGHGVLIGVSVLVGVYLIADDDNLPVGVHGRASLGNGNGTLARQVLARQRARLVLNLLR